MSPKSSPNQPPPHQRCQKDYPFKSCIYDSKLSYSSKPQVPQKISTGKNRHERLGLGLRSVVKCLTPMHETLGSVFNTDEGGKEEGRERGKKRKRKPTSSWVSEPQNTHISRYEALWRKPWYLKFNNYMIIQEKVTFNSGSTIKSKWELKKKKEYHKATELA